MALLESGEMYLETILILSQSMTTVRAINIGEYMGFSKPSVSRAMGLLKKGGYIRVDGGGAITLTDAGREVAEKIYDRHTTITRILENLGVSHDAAVEDACKMEHYISEETFTAFRRHLECFGKNAEKEGNGKK
ncbi:MAG: metal-dependent transcriptional regulator [Clostridia bacterium]|nr:metal-dependent transcriptional regulator [Clostridia bacterium]